MSNGDAGSTKDRPTLEYATPPRQRRAPRIVEDGAWVAVGQTVVVVAGLGGTRLLTELLPPEVYGQLSLVMGLVAFGVGSVCTPLLQATLRSFPDARDAGAIGALRALSGYHLRRAVAAVAALLAAAGVGWALWATAPVSLLVFPVAAALAALEVWRSFEAALLNAARRQRDFALRMSLDAVARPALAAALVLGLGVSALHVLVGFAVGTAVVGVFLRRRIVTGEGGVRSRHDPWAQSHRADFLRYAIPLIPVAALNWTMSLGDRYVLAATWGTDAVGVYWAAYTLGSQSFIAAGTLIFTTLRPVLYDAVARGDARKERRTLRVWMLIVGTVALTGWLLTTVFANALCRLLLGPAYRAAAGLLPWIAAAYALQMVQQSFEMILYAHGKSRALVAIQAGAAISAIVFYLALIPRYGALGAALGTLGTFIFTTTMAFVLSGAARRVFGAEPPV